MFILRDPAVGTASGTCELLTLKPVKSVPHGVFAEVHHRLAIVLLIAGVHQRIQRKRIVVWRSDVLLDQRSQDSSLNFAELNIHVLSLHDRRGRKGYYSRR